MHLYEPENSTPAKQVRLEAPSALKPYARNARTHSHKQVRKIARSIERFGFLNPILVDGNNTVLCGHGRLEAAKLLGLEEVPTFLADHLTEAEKKVYIIADNRIAADSGWDREILALELETLVEMDFEVEFTGFDLAAIEIAIGGHDKARGRGPEPKDEFRRGEGAGDCSARRPLQLGPHQLLCGECGREFDPHFCDAILRRYEKMAGKQAIHAASGKSLEEVAEERLAVANDGGDPISANGGTSRAAKPPARRSKRQQRASIERASATRVA